MQWRKWFAGGSVVLALGACGSSTTPAAAGGTGTDTASQAGQDVKGSGTDTASGPDTKAGPSVEVLELQTTISVLVNNEQQQAALKGVVLHPVTCTSTSQCPLVVVVGDYDGNAYDAYVPAASKLAAGVNVNVVIFNLPGQGPASKKSSGTDDFGGLWHETAVKEVMRFIAQRPYVDQKRCGYLTIGTGLIPVVRALKVYGTSALSFVNFLIDVEGPTDRCAVSQAPEDDGKGIGPSDGAGASDSACHFTTKAPHSAVYPAAQDGKPASIVCAEGAWPIAATGVTCSDSSWWSAREPYTYLSDLFTRYQRIQFTNDHRLPSYWSSRMAIQRVAGSPSHYFALNDMPPCQAPLTDDECVGQPCWLEGPYGNGLAPAPFAAGKLKPISTDDLFTQVLPGYVQRMIDDKTYPNCK